MHEVTRRVLSVLLTRLEGFKGKSRTMMICSTNRKEDLDSALLSRFDLMITYCLPAFSTRQEIFKRYAKQFLQAKSSSEDDVYQLLAEASEGLSCRDIKEACQQAERICAYHYIQQQTLQQKKKEEATSNDKSWLQSMLAIAGSKQSSELSPKLDDYLSSLRQRQAQQQDGSKAMRNKHAAPYTSV
jgi:ATP-dependent 26S proteasome regulatory subunit